MGDALRDKLEAGIDYLSINLSSHTVDNLLSYLRLLIKWNKAYNLTAIRDPAEMIDKHLLDSLSMVPHMQADRILDVGTGAGLPGMILAIVYPKKIFTLLDTNGKKTRFLIQAKLELKLDNVIIENRRVESWHPDTLFPVVMSRAFSSIVDMVDWTQHLMAKNGVILAMKGVYPEKEIEFLPTNFKITASHKLVVPGLNSERHLLEIKRC